jgi:hypothetical protein
MKIARHPFFPFTPLIRCSAAALFLSVVVLNNFIKADELPQAAGDELPPGLEVAIRNPAIPMIVDATITSFTKEGYAKIKVNKVYKAPAGKKAGMPATVRGYRMDGANARIVPIRIITDKGKKRFLFFLQGDLLYSTYNNRFEIKEDKAGKLIVQTGRKWQPLADMTKLIAGNAPVIIECFRGILPNHMCRVPPQLRPRL